MSGEEGARKGKAAILGQPPEGGAVTLVAGGVRVALRVTPKAAANRIGRLSQESGGTVALKVAVTAIPENGRANAAVVQLLARAWKLPQRSLSIVTGSGDRRKILLIAGEPIALAHHLHEWILSRHS